MQYNVEYNNMLNVDLFQGFCEKYSEPFLM